MLILLLTNQALAASDRTPNCAALMNLLEAGTPATVIGQTITTSGQTMSDDDVRCLTEQGAPTEIVSAAQAAVPPARTPVATSDPTRAEDTGRKRSFLMEVNFRARYLDLPDSILDIWYEDHKEDPNIPDRPHVGAYILGGEFVIKDDRANGIFYAEWIKPTLEPGYWDDREEPPDDGDGSFVRPEGFGLVAIGADYAYEIKANSWFSFLVGAGLGVGFRTGELQEWRPGDTDGMCGYLQTAYERAEDCDPDQIVEVPGAIPIIDVNVGPKFNFGDKASLRLEGGLHNLPYGGATLGVVF
jgi:hypothetical protein